jgi:hypothetical protein
MRNDNQRNEAAKAPQQQTDENRSPVKSRQLKENTVPERWDTPRGSEIETRGAAGPRGGGSGRS